MVKKVYVHSDGMLRDALCVYKLSTVNMQAMNAGFSASLTNPL